MPCVGFPQWDGLSASSRGRLRRVPKVFVVNQAAPRHAAPGLAARGSPRSPAVTSIQSGEPSLAVAWLDKDEGKRDKNGKMTIR